MTRPLTLEVAESNDPQKPKLSRWVIRLSHAGMPVTHLVCSSPTPLFARTVMLYENVIDDRGNTQRRMLSEALWTQTPDQATREFELDVNGRVQGETLILEADNGDNPPIELSGFKAYYPVTRILFKAGPGEQVFLYYGNGRAAPPHYDLALVAGQFHETPMGAATLGAPEQLRKVPARGVGGRGGPIFWGILGLVVVVLLAIIARLLPKQT
jgi:hypothetical protein